MTEKNKYNIDIEKLLQEISIQDEMLDDMINECLSLWIKSNNNTLIECANTIKNNIKNPDYKKEIKEIIKEASILSGFIISLDKKYDIFKDPDIFIATRKNKEKKMLKKEIVTRGIAMNKNIIRATKMSMGVINLRTDFYLSI